MLNVENISITFNEGTLDEKKALQHINLHMKKGDFVTVIGSNGAGKSTLMNMISGSLRPDNGNVKINEKDVTALPEYRKGFSGSNGRNGTIYDD